jgi:hypothetical protein
MLLTTVNAWEGLMRARVFAMVLALLLLVSFVGDGVVVAQAGKVSGTLAVDGKKVPVQHIAAVTYDTPSQGRLISVLLSDKPPDAKTFNEYTRIGPGERYVAGIIRGAWVAMHMDNELSGFTFTIDAQKRLMLNDFLVGGKGKVFGVTDDAYVLEVTATSPRLVGRLRTKDAVYDTGSGKVSLDVTFDTPVTVIGK